MANGWHHAREYRKICSDDWLDVACPLRAGENVVWHSNDILLMKDLPQRVFNLKFEGFPDREIPMQLFCFKATADMTWTAPALPASNLGGGEEEESGNAAFRVQA